MGTIESVWDDLRPPRVEAPGELVTVTLTGAASANRRKSGPAPEVDAPPVYYASIGPGMPEQLARLHLGLAVGTPVRCSAAVATWPADAPRLPDLITGAGFLVDRQRRTGGRWLVDARRDRTLPDFVAGGMRMLVCGLNPSLVAADAGFGYAGATNRFWPAVAAAGVVTHPRDPLAALAEDGMGMTDLVKRATPNADSLTPGEYQAGVERVQRLVEWLRPGVVVFVGLAGWRAAVDRRAAPGLQPSLFGGSPAYVMPSTSGRNARTPPAALIAHFEAALAISTRA
ncbi:MAG TPA: mismatch-specific DNA-glycosylase [Acidimicrobiia bacterium]|nr:mismatch-specific DNA-glycosylase [Acidimicrobiia bacterium]